jgi:uncharacterized protein DUF5134
MIDQVLTGAVIAVTLPCLARLVLRRGETRPAERNLDFAQALMGIGMAAMFLPQVLPPGVWAAVFVANAAWLGALALRRRPALTYLHHLVSGLSMAYMFAAARSHGSGAHGSGAHESGVQGPTSHVLSLSSAHSSGHGHGSALAVVDVQPAGFAFPLVAWILMIYCALSAGFAGTDLWRPSPACGARSAPRLAATTELVLSLSMGYMFLTTL